MLALFNKQHIPRIQQESRFIIGNLLMYRLILIALLLFASSASTADLTRIERKIANEPKYQSKSPRYALLAFGPDAADRVWLVQDGDNLHILPDGPALAKALKLHGKKSDDGIAFLLDQLTLNGKNHRRLNIGFVQLKRWAGREELQHPEMVAALKANPLAEALIIQVEAELPDLRPKGHTFFMVGPFDLAGPLMPAESADKAPIVHFGGPLQITFFFSRPTLRRNRPVDATLVVGTPGLGKGAFAMVGYDETIPAKIHPTAEITFPPSKAGGEPIKQRFELKERC